MKFNRFVLIVLLLTGAYSYSQSKKDIIFTVDSKPVYSTEFLRVFNKNRDIVDDENKKTIDEYLELYINYKLKLKQAYELGLDTASSYKKELEKYREQLVQPYLKDSKVTTALVKEAYSRMKVEVNASHILVKLDPKASPADTLKAYNKIMEARSKVIAGTPFNQVAKNYSEDPSAQKNGGDLGYFSAFGMVYSFENVAYTNDIGKVSLPFKTNFGYHIVKVNDKRPSKGEVEVAHIMIKNKKSDSLFAETQINDLYAKIQQGDKFDFLARKYSEDRQSAVKGGKLQKFTANRMIKPFADVSFSLEKEGDISRPFKTPYGWHVVQLVKKHPVKSYEELKDELTKKIEKSERARAIGKSVADRLKKEFQINYDNDIKRIFLQNDTEKIASNSDNMIYSINGEKIKLKDLVAYNSKQRNKSLRTTYNDFLNEKVLDYYKDHLEERNQDFAITMQEYKDGLLLFDLLQQKVWTRSEKDTIALQEYFSNHREAYKHQKRGDLILATCTRLEKAELVKKLFADNKSIDQIKELVNEGPTIHVLFSQGIIEADNKKLPKNFVLKKGVSEIYNEEKNFFVVKVNEVLEASLKELSEAKGLVMNDFQEQLEKDWIAELRNKYLVKINKRTLKRLIKQNPN